MKSAICSLLGGSLLLCTGVASAEGSTPHKVIVAINAVSADGVGKSLGTIMFADTNEGVLVTPDLAGLPPGDHGFHVHENPSCEPKEKDGVMTAAQAAGPHFDPHKTGKHMGPHGGGHAGDLPVLVVSPDGTATKNAVVKGLHVADIMNRSVMIHGGGDNYSDTPAPLGGGGARIACGVVK
jgi:Cu-Zn family superoxide dismutase